MNIQVNLKDIIEEMEVQFEESLSLFNLKTGEIFLVTSEELRLLKTKNHLIIYLNGNKNRMIAIDVVENFENYIELPTKYEVNEYEIMENFCLTVRDQQKQESLLRVIKGKGAFRRFKDKIIDFEIEDQWYTYRDESIKQIAIEWCHENKINFIE